MARVKDAMNARKKHKKVLKLAKGYRGSRSKLYRPANTFVMKALKNAYIGRKLKKRDFRKLWIQRINPAGSCIAISDNIFLLTSTPANFNPFINLE